MIGAIMMAGRSTFAQEPPALNPFGPRAAQRDDAVPGTLTLSTGVTHRGQIYLTRDARLQIQDETQGRVREVPLAAVSRIECRVVEEWLEREWRFLENANDQKVYTGRSYPARVYQHTIRLRDGRAITGPLSAIVYVQEAPDTAPLKFLIHKRDKGPVGSDLKSLQFVQTIELEGPSGGVSSP